MIVRPVNRPRPIPFTAPAAGATATRPVSWAAASGPAAPNGGESRPHVHATTVALAPTTARLSPVKVAPALRDVRHALQPVLQAAPGPVTGAQGGAANKLTQISAKYMGQGALSVRSSVTGKHYRFQGHGDCQAIDKLDLMLLRRIADLVVL